MLDGSESTLTGVVTAAAPGACLLSLALCSVAHYRVRQKTRAISAQQVHVGGSHSASAGPGRLLDRLVSLHRLCPGRH
jgi:hypothetical protein